jgi:two-component system cell cycle response regulator
VNHSKTLKLLVVEDDLEDEQLLCQALIEIEENRQWWHWSAAAVVQVDQLTDALDCLRRERFDAVLLNLSLPDSPSLLDTFLEVTACAPEAPIIVLADEPDENLANRLLREGAQDVLLKSDLDCAPLARSIRYSIERQRRIAPLQISSSAGDLAGTSTQPVVPEVSEDYELLLASLEISDLPEGAARDLSDPPPLAEETCPTKTVMLLD